MPLRSGFAVLITAFLVYGSVFAAEPTHRLLFLGDQGHHRPADRFRQLAPVLAERGIELTYSEAMEDLNPAKLSQYDGLVIYANQTKISPEQEKALLDYVAGGKGFIPLHCASYCFLNSEAYIALVGAQFKSHTTGTFRTRITNPRHPVMQGFPGFQSWDETYVHTKHNEKDRTVLEVRADGERFEPWTWVRTHGKGRVFYTAWGHDHQTWGEPGFQILVERGIRWAVGGDPTKAPELKDDQAFVIPEMTAQRSDRKPLEYDDVGEGKIPTYKKGEKWGVKGEELTLMQRPLMPAESQKHIVTPVDFEPQLFMSEQDFQGGKPIAMTWDARGRLWICETIDYPNELQPPGQGRDRVRICEDTNGDGRADKFTIFAEKLSIPTSIAFHKNGAIVQNGAETLYLQDTDGDDRADRTTKLFEGWGIGDTHGQVSNFVYGHDNWIWAMQGYNNSAPTVKGTPTQSFRMGFFRFKPDGSEIEFIRSTNNNTWGIGVSEEGIIFGSTANHNPSNYMPIANRYYERVRGWSPQVLGPIADTHLFQPITDKVRQVDQFGGYTAGAGHALYTARTYPQEYWNRVAFVAEPTGHLVGAFVLRKEGSDFTSQNSFNLFASTDEWSSPIMAEVGPDGNVWVLDWYNYIIQHNPTPVGFKTGKGNAYESELRDKKHGRVYRIVAKNAKAASIPNLAGASPELLVKTLAHENLLWRRHAQRLLVERGQSDVVPSLMALVENQTVDAIGLNVGAIHALHTLSGLGALADANSPASVVAAGKAVKHPSAGVRRNALQVLAGSPAGGQAALAALDDTDAQVRLAALLAIADTTSENSPHYGEAIAKLLADPQAKLDRWLRDAAVSAAAAHDTAFLAAAVKTGDSATPTETLLSVCEQIGEHYARGAPAENVGELLVQFKSGKPLVAEAALKGLARGWPKGKPAQLKAAHEEAIQGLFQTVSASAKSHVISLSAKIGSKRLEQYAAEIAAVYLKTIGDSVAKPEQRIEAARQLIDFRKLDVEAVSQLLAQIGPKTPPELASGWIDAIRSSEAPEAGSIVIESLGRLTPAARKSALQLLLSRTDWTSALLTAVEKGKVQFGELALDQKQSLAAHPDKEIAKKAKALLAAGGGLPNADRQKVVAEFMPITKVTGDAEAGKLVFEKQCAKCHMHGGKGNKIGPDLTGMAVHPKAELLVHILDPSRSVEGNYRVYQVTLESGKIITGLLASESKTAIELFDAEGKRHTIVRDEIEELNASPKSLMPEGFEKQATQAEMTNLLEFLTKRGKFTPLPLDKFATIVSTKGMFHSEESAVERMIFSDWSPKTFQGVPFTLVDPQGDRVPNCILLYGTGGSIPPKMPKKVTLPCNQSAKAIHLLSGVAGWGYPAGQEKSVSLTVRLKYDDGSTEDHDLLDGVHFADYIRRVDVPESQFAFALRGQQLRYLAIRPKKSEKIKEIELVKEKGVSSPIVMAVTIEGIESK